MLVAVILLIVCQAITPLVVALVARRWIRGQVRAVQDAINTELLKLINGDPCQTAAVLNAAGRVIGSEAGRSAKASLMADLSHLKRAENTAANDQQLALIGDQSPGIGQVLAGMGPGKRSGLMKNPLVQLAIQAFLGGQPFSGGSTPGNGQGGSTAEGSVRDRLKKGA